MPVIEFPDSPIFPDEDVFGFADAKGRRVFGWSFSSIKPTEPVLLQIIVDGGVPIEILANRRATAMLPPNAPHLFCGFEFLLNTELASRDVVVRVAEGPVLFERKVNLGFVTKAHLEAKLYDNKRIDGWAWSPQSGDRVKIDVTLGSGRSFVIETNRFRPDLLAIGIERALCGYSIDLRQLSIGPGVGSVTLRALGLERKIEVPAIANGPSPSLYEGLSAQILFPMPRRVISF